MEPTYGINQPMNSNINNDYSSLAQFQNQGTNKPKFKIHIGTEELRQIVGILNQPPFLLNLTLVGFDEKQPLELLELLNNILADIDPKHKVDIRKEKQETTAERITEFLRILDYPVNIEMAFQDSLVKGDRKIIYPILFWILTRLDEHKKRAYLAKYLVPLAVPSQYLVEADADQVHTQYKELQAEFQATHQHVDKMRLESQNPKEIQKKLQQLEQEKEQLVFKINQLKKKNAGKAEFQELVQTTSLLRKEQEEGSRLYEKYMEQKAQLEWYEQQLLMAKQKLLDSKKMSGKNTSPEMMLQMISNEVKKDRQMLNEVIGRELIEKSKRLQQDELILMEPAMSQNDLERISNEIKKLQREVSSLEEKAKKGNTQDDKLAIYKSQANTMSKKKEKSLEELTKSEQELQMVEKKIQEKEKEYAQAKGKKFTKAGDFNQMANSLKSKTSKYNDMMNIMKELKSEIACLVNTEIVLKKDL